MRAARTFLIVFMLLPALLTGCGGVETQSDAQESVPAAEPTPPDEIAYSEARAIEDPAAREAAWLSFLEGFPESERRPAALYYTWTLKKEADAAAALAWAETMLRTEPSDKGKGQLYRSLFTSAVDREDETEGLRIARELAAAELDAPRYNNAVAWALVDDPGWDPALGVSMAERAAEGASGRDKAQFLDTAGWGNYKLEYHDLAVLQLNAALSELSEPDPDVADHLEAVYKAQGDEEGLLTLYNMLLTFRVDSEMQSRAELMAAAAGHDLHLYRAKIWEHRMNRAKPAADFELTDLDGQAHRLSDYKGKIVMINFWHPT
jgi:hypothetical protein